MIERLQVITRLMLYLTLTHYKDTIEEIKAARSLSKPFRIPSSYLGNISNTEMSEMFLLLAADISRLTLILF